MLSKETATLILFNHIQELVNGRNLWAYIVLVPLKIPPHLVYFPIHDFLDESYLGNSGLDDVNKQISNPEEMAVHSN